MTRTSIGLILVTVTTSATKVHRSRSFARQPDGDGDLLTWPEHAPNLVDTGSQTAPCREASQSPCHYMWAALLQHMCSNLPCHGRWTVIAFGGVSLPSPNLTSCLAASPCLPCRCCACHSCKSISIYNLRPGATNDPKRLDPVCYALLRCAFADVTLREVSQSFLTWHPPDGSAATATPSHGVELSPRFLQFVRCLDIDESIEIERRRGYRLRQSTVASGSAFVLKCHWYFRACRPSLALFRG